MMFRNHWKVATRNLWKSKGFSVINITGLALGMACSLLIFLWVQDEKNINAFHTKTDRLYQVYERQYFDKTITGQYYTPGPLADELKKQIPEIEMACGVGWPWPQTLSAGATVLKQSGTAAGRDYFKMFSFPLVEGSAEEALSTPESIAISQSTARRFFGSAAAAMHKTIRYENKRDFIVKAVYADQTAQSSMQFDFVYNWQAFIQMNKWLDAWGNNEPNAFVLLRKDAAPAATEAKIKGFIERFENSSENGFHVEVGLQLFNKVYLQSNFENGYPAGGRIEYVHLFTLVAVFIVLIACINFMNLTTARSVKRAREIGVRKVIGAGRGLLIGQFMGEALLIVFFAAILAVLLVMLALPFFNRVTGKQMVLTFGNTQFLSMLAGLTVITGLLSGSYPALFLSRLNPIRIFKGGGLKAGPGALWLRKVLVVFQFTLSIILIISTILISRQVNYVQQANLGYDRENLVYVQLDEKMGEILPAYITEASRIKGVGAISSANQSPTNTDNGTMGVTWPGKDPASKPSFAQLATGYDFMKTMKIQMVTGRDFSRDFISDSSGYIINEAAAKKIGYTNPIGQPLTFWGEAGNIVGVVKDFNFQSLHGEIRPLIIRLAKKGEGSILVVRTLPGHTQTALTQLEKLWKQMDPETPFTFQFSSEEYTKLYKSEQVIQSLSNAFALLAIVISCMGLLGLSMFTAEQRTREFGIRKVLGANLFTLCSLLSGNFLLLVGIAFTIAAPVAWWAMHVWLKHFAYRTSISWWIFGLAGVAAFVIAQFTILFQAVKVARANPVTSLKSE